MKKSLNHYFAYYLILLITILSFSSICYGQKNYKSSPYTIESINAYLYYETKGEFSKIPTDSMELFNTIIGEGSAEAPSNSTLVVVRIKRNFLEDTEYRKIRLTATVNKRTVLQQTMDCNLYDENFYLYAAFLIYDTGCESIYLLAELLNEKEVQGKKKISVEGSKRKEINFYCGE